MIPRGWWRPGRGRLGHAIAWCLTCLLAVDVLGCTGVRSVIPTRANVSLISPWRYYDLWQTLRIGRGLLVGTRTGDLLSGKFVSGGARTIRIDSETGVRDIPITEIRYLIDVIDLSYAREGAVAGGIIGLGAGLGLGFATAGATGSTAARPTRTARAADTNDSPGDTQSTDTQSNTSATDTGASNTQGGQSSTSTAADAGGAVSQSSSGNSSTSTTDPTTTGSNTYDGGSSSGGSSAGSGTSNNTSPTGTQSSQSSGNSTVIVQVGGTAQSSGQSSAGGAAAGEGGGGAGGTQGGSSLSPAWHMLFYTVGFAAVGTVVGWFVGRTKRQAIPRVDYILFPANLTDQGTRSPDQYLADQIATPTGDEPASTLLPGSRFDSPRSAMLFEQFAQSGTVVRLADGVPDVISASDANAYKLFPTVKEFRQAIIVSCGSSTEQAGQECRYLAVITRGPESSPSVSLERLSPRDVIRLGTQVSLIRAGIVR